MSVSTKAVAFFCAMVFLTACGGSESAPSNPPANHAPIADAGPDRNVSSASTVMLDGSGSSDADGDALTYAWRITSKPDDSNASLSDASAVNPSFMADSDGVYMIALVVSDGVESAGDFVTVTVSANLTGNGLPLFGPDLSQCPAPLDADRPDTLYVCDCQSGADSACVAGDDAAEGTFLAPKRSLSAADAAVANGIDVAFCRGGLWRGGEFTLNLGTNCSVDDPCVLQDYGDATKPLPIIENTLIDGTAGVSMDTHDNAISASGYTFANLHLKKASPDSASTGLSIFRGISHVTMRCLEIENFGVGVQLNPNGTFSHDILLADSYIYNNTEDGFLGGTTDLTIIRTTFENNGYGLHSAFQHNVYIGGDGSWNVPMDNITVRQNHLIGSALDADGQCQGTSLNVHGGVMNDTHIISNLVEELNPSGGCWGIAVDGITGTGDTHNRTVIRGNVVKNVGINAIGISSCIDCTIENNIVAQAMTQGSLGIAVTNRPTSAPEADNNATTVRNNTIWFGKGMRGEGIYVGERGSGYSVSNNIVGFETDNALNICYRYDLPKGSYDLVSHNLCHGGTYDAGTTGMDEQPFTADPQFENAPDSLMLNRASPGIDAGTVVSASFQDIRLRDRDAHPDLGAYEFSAR